jgi:hypothetical protein
MKFKELLLREEPRQGGLVVPFRSVLGARLEDIGRSFYGILDAVFEFFVWGSVFEFFVFGPTFNHEGVLAIEMWNRSKISRDHGPLVSCSCTRRSHGILPRVHFRHAVYLTNPE